MWNHKWQGCENDFEKDALLDIYKKPTEEIKGKTQIINHDNGLENVLLDLQKGLVLVKMM